jgi:HTH-type transcriptional regulator/antitoxin HigA
LEKGLHVMPPPMTAYQTLLVEYQPRPIRTERDHQRALRQVEKLMRGRSDCETSQLIELLGTLIEQYESQDDPTPRNSPRDMLAHFLENRGLTRSELARKTGIPPSVITNVLVGRRQISKSTALRLAEFFGVSVSHFI